ncbi:MAG: riboflavin synthase [Vicinamibacterales bacterium]
MFTGLIEGVGRVTAVTPDAAGLRIRLQTRLAGELAPGDSLAVNGVCLTVTRVARDEIHADLGPETARVTTLGGLVAGAAVNLERPLRGDGRFGGHFVQGHVDGVGRVVEVREEGDAHWLRIGFPPEAAPLLVAKGSVAVDGVSLTVATLLDDAFEVMLIPFTWTNTALAGRKAGDRVNLEFDIVGKYVLRSVRLQADRNP